MGPGSSRRTALLEVLDRARRLGFVGPGPVEDHVRHAEAMAEVIEPDLPSSAADLGSGAGIPGLVLALRWPIARFALVESAERRTTFLHGAVTRLELTGQVVVLAERAEAIGRDPAHRGRFDLVTARSFGPPAVVAECAAPLLRPGGRLVVSEPPESSPDRWPPAGLAALGMERAATIGSSFFHFQIVRQVDDCPDDFPRRTGVPAKRPLF